MTTPIDNLANALQAMARETEGLRQDYAAEALTRAKETKLAKQRQWFNIALMILLALLMSIGLVAIKQTSEISTLLVDCTVKGGKCYGEGTKRSGKVVEDLGRRQVYIIECARQFPDEKGQEFDRKFEKCVTDRLAEPAK